MSTVRDIVLVALGGALWLALSIVTAVFSAVPGFFFLSLPILLSGVYSVWFGKKGLLMSVLGFLLQDLQKGISPLVGWGDFVGVTLVIMLPLWFFLPTGASEFKRVRDIVTYYAMAVPLTFVGFFIVVYAFVVMGIIPADAAFPIYLGVMAATGGVMWVADGVLLRTVTPFLKRAGLYDGTYREQRAKVAG